MEARAQHRYATLAALSTVEDYKDPLTGEDKIANIPYDSRMHAVFDDVAKSTTPIDKAKSDTGQQRKATRDLRDRMRKSSGATSDFTPAQLAAIKSGGSSIPGYTWHHNPSNNTMQLVPIDIHDPVSCMGERAITRGR